MSKKLWKFRKVQDDSESLYFMVVKRTLIQVRGKISRRAHILNTLSSNTTSIHLKSLYFFLYYPLDTLPTIK